MPDRRKAQGEEGEEGRVGREQGQQVASSPGWPCPRVASRTWCPGRGRRAVPEHSCLPWPRGRAWC